MSAPLQFRRAKDFASSGIYELETAEGVKRAFRDPETRAWINPDAPVSVYRPISGFIGWTKQEALAALAAA